MWTYDVLDIIWGNNAIFIFEQNLPSSVRLHVDKKKWLAVFLYSINTEPTDIPNALSLPMTPQYVPLSKPKLEKRRKTPQTIFGAQKLQSLSGCLLF